MNEPETVIIPLNLEKTRSSVFLWLAAALLIAAPLWPLIVLVQPGGMLFKTFSRPGLNLFRFVWIGLLILPLASLALTAAAIALKRALMIWNHTPALTIDARGLTDHSALAAAGHIPWAEIIYIDFDGWRIIPHLKDPRKYVLPGPNLFAAANRLTNLKILGAPFIICGPLAAVETDLAWKIIAAKYEKNKVPPNRDSDVIVKVNRFKALRNLILTLSLGAGLIWTAFWIHPPRINDADDLIGVVIAWLTGLVGGAGALYLVLIWAGTLINGGIVLKVGARGVSHESWPHGVGFVAWEDVENVAYRKGTEHQPPLILIFPRDAEALMRGHSAFRRYFMNNVFKKFGTPMAIDLNIGRASGGELWSLVHSYYEKYKRPQPPQVNR